jgi:hypothetical protein
MAVAAQKVETKKTANGAAIQDAYQMMNVVYQSPKGIVTDSDILLWSQAGIIPANTPPEQVKIFASICAQTQLSPSRKQIYLMEVKGKWLSYVSNEGLRTLVHRTGVYCGCAPTRFNERSNGTFDTYTEVVEALRTGVYPLTCTFTGYAYDRRGNKCAYTKTVSFNEFARDNHTWRNMPIQMIEKTAKSFVYKEMLGEEMTGIYTEADVEYLTGEADPNFAVAPDAVDPIMVEAQQIAAAAQDEADLKLSVSAFLKKHGIVSLDYCPNAAQILRGRVRELRAAKKAAREVVAE